MLPKSWEIGFGWFPYSSLEPLRSAWAFLHGSLQQLGARGLILPRTRPFLASHLPLFPTPSDHPFSISPYGHNHRADLDLLENERGCFANPAAPGNLKSSFQGLLSALACTPLPPNSVDEKTEVPGETEAGGRA